MINVPNKNIQNKNSTLHNTSTQNADRGTKMLKLIGETILLFPIVVLITIFSFLIFTFVGVLSLGAIILTLILTIPFIILFKDTFIISFKDDVYHNVDVVVVIVAGIIVGVIIAQTYVVPVANVIQYSVSMRATYVNNPNITITQNCTAFSVSSKGYVNGKPIDPKNTTECEFPSNMSKNTITPFECHIFGKNMTCTNEIFGTGGFTSKDYNITWNGVILKFTERQ